LKQHRFGVAGYVNEDLFQRLMYRRDETSGLVWLRILLLYYGGMKGIWCCLRMVLPTLLAWLVLQQEVHQPQPVEFL
jgi:hypothetical protein